MSKIPPLAGICIYEEAARVGYSVEQNVTFFLRYAWLEKLTMETTLYWISPTPEWEIKEALSLHCHLDADHAKQQNWWPNFVKHALGRETEMPDFNLVRL